MPKVTIIKSDITQLAVDAIVNSANPSLLAGSGLCGVIHKGAGPELELECKKIGGCSKGEAVITKGFNLKAKNIIHAVGPHYIFDGQEREKLLENCYLSILRLADCNNIKSLAIPAISTGIYKYPIEEATKIALKTVSDFIETENKNIEEIIFVLFSKEVKEVYDILFPYYFLDLLD